MGCFLMKIRLATIEDATGIARVHVDSWRTTYTGIVDPSFLDSLSYEEREQRWRQVIPSDPPFVAVNKDHEVIGFANGGKERTGKFAPYESEVYAIYLLEPYQGKGLGRKLIQAVVNQLIEAGYESLIIRVLSENEARFFYEAIGGVIVTEGELTIGNKTHKEIVYGWQSLESFVTS